MNIYEQIIVCMALDNVGDNVPSILANDFLDKSLSIQDMPTPADKFSTESAYRNIRQNLTLLTFYKPEEDSIPDGYTFKGESLLNMRWEDIYPDLMFISNSRIIDDIQLIYDNKSFTASIDQYIESVGQEEACKTFRWLDTSPKINKRSLFIDSIPQDNILDGYTDSHMDSLVYKLYLEFLLKTSFIYQAIPEIDSLKELGNILKEDIINWYTNFGVDVDYKKRQYDSDVVYIKRNGVPIDQDVNIKIYISSELDVVDGVLFATNGDDIEIVNTTIKNLFKEDWKNISHGSGFDGEKLSNYYLDSYIEDKYGVGVVRAENDDIEIDSSVRIEDNDALTKTVVIRIRVYNMDKHIISNTDIGYAIMEYEDGEVKYYMNKDQCGWSDDNLYMSKDDMNAILVIVGRNDGIRGY